MFTVHLEQTHQSLIVSQHMAALEERPLDLREEQKVGHYGNRSLSIM
jgi:hypothetical protein